MATVAEVVGHAGYKGILFGVECEVEGERLPEVLPRGLPIRVEADGSLRGGLEYVFSKPLKKNIALKSLSVLFSQFEEAKSKLDYSFRTSTHVHVNVSDVQVSKVLNIIFLYTLVEDLFVHYCAEHRRGNRFCLRFKEAQHLYHILEQMIHYARNGREDHVIAVLDQQVTKYAALNLFTLRKYGTLEFRSLEGTNDLEKISKWIDAIENLVTVAQKYDSISALHEAFFNDPEKIVDEIFTSPEFKYDGWRVGVEESYSQSFHLVLVDKGVF